MDFVEIIKEKEKEEKEKEEKEKEKEEKEKVDKEENKLKKEKVDKMIIHNYELSNNKYDIVLLEDNIDRLSLKKLLQTQHLTAEFCKIYLLQPDLYGMSSEDYYITVEDILLYQPHLREKLTISIR